MPDIYTDSQDFRFFLDWFSMCLSKTQYDIESMLDLYDPLRCPTDLLWMLADTMGFKYDDRLNPAYNRLVLLYFMSMIYLRGSRNGMILAAETNLAQFHLQDVTEQKEILAERLEDTSIPVNSVSVIPHPEDGYIDVVYFSENIPVDACIEYVRPLGMYAFQQAGVRMDGRTKIAIDARLTDTKDMQMSFGPTFVGHYNRADYASMQSGDTPRNPVWYRNSVYEGSTNPKINPGLRALNSLQLCNGEEVVMSLLPSIFSLGYGPQTTSEEFPDVEVTDPPMWNLRYDKTTDDRYTPKTQDNELVVGTLDDSRTTDIMHPRPAINNPMSQLGDPMSQ
jgi:hypothetical protein